MNYVTKRTVDPATTAVAIETVKNYLRVDTNDEDEQIAVMTQMACDYVSAYLGQALITETRKLILPYLPAFISLPYPPLVAVTSVQYYDEDEVLQTIASTDYRVYSDSTPAIIKPITSWDISPMSDRDDAVQVTYTCGYGSDPTDVPPVIRIAICALVHDYYEDRGMEGESHKTNTSFARLMGTIRKGGVL